MASAFFSWPQSQQGLLHFHYCRPLRASESVVFVSSLTLASSSVSSLWSLWPLPLAYFLLHFHLSESLYLKKDFLPTAFFSHHHHLTRLSPALILTLPLHGCTQSALSYVDCISILLTNNCEHLKRMASFSSHTVTFSTIPCT